MSLNAYGGTFVGLKAIREGLKIENIQPNKKFQFPELDEKAEKVIVTLISVEKLMLPKVKAPSKLELVVTVIFDKDSIEESLKHSRQNSKIIEPEFVHNSYYGSFNSYEMVLPCDKRKVLTLYLSCITTTVLEDRSKRVEFRGYAYTQMIDLSKCVDHKQNKEEMKLTEENGTKGVMITFRVVTTKANIGPEVQEDKICKLVNLCYFFLAFWTSSNQRKSESF
ncbi:uncharacterized protein TA04110 [Theileria annulata]|uniref:Uncharacterized protein n=1 Tax=Theileria annulata TaxID=5874 RepID=Q4UC82_THEAN|nr:uncharacterized protein TA04110 [Theileria annulata]CAI75569.1 hypothetical protein TA04110 [Theileria annulata]|eukprot:XP_955045.1 hypothetical protein TA04110 [Theileria annulata]